MFPVVRSLGNRSVDNKITGFILGSGIHERYETVARPPTRYPDKSHRVRKLLTFLKPLCCADKGNVAMSQKLSIS